MAVADEGGEVATPRQQLPCERQPLSTIPGGVASRLSPERSSRAADHRGPSTFQGILVMDVGAPILLASAQTMSSSRVRRLEGCSGSLCRPADIGGVGILAAQGLPATATGVELGR